MGEINRVEDVCLHQLNDCLRRGFTSVRGRERQLLRWRGRRQQEHFCCLLVHILPMRRPHRIAVRSVAGAMRRGSRRIAINRVAKRRITCS